MWNKLEPARSYLYTLLAPVVAVLVYYGIVADVAAPLWIALATGVLGVTGTEVARAKVTPTVSPPSQREDGTWNWK